jgi:hypothetical protein
MTPKEAVKELFEGTDEGKIFIGAFLQIQIVAGGSAFEIHSSATGSDGMAIVHSTDVPVLREVLQEIEARQLGKPSKK